MRPCVPIALRDRLYALFAGSLEPGDALSRFQSRAKNLVAGNVAESDYLKDRLPRFERVLVRWPAIRAIPDALDRDLEMGSALFNEGLFFDCHEHLEGAWRRCEGGAKTMVQGLIQAGAAFHKLELGSPAGCAELLGKAVEKLSGLRGPHRASLRAFAAGLEAARKEALRGDFDLSRVPRIRV